MDQLNVVIKDVAKLVSSIMVFAGGAYQVWKSTQKNTIVDAAAIPGTVVVAPEAIAATTPQANIVSNEEKKVVSQ